MATISPIAVALNPLETQQFTQSGISVPVWTLDGIGSLNQSGFYTAPSGGGSANVRVHSSFWYDFNSAYFTKNADDTLTKNTSTSGYYDQARSNGQLNTVGDYVEFIAARENPFWAGLDNGAGTYRFVYFAGANPNYLAIYHPSGSQNLPIPRFYENDVIKIEIITGGYLRLSQNGTIVHTSSQVFSGQNLRFVVDADLANGTVVKVPKLQGSNYTEAATTVTIQLPILLPRTNLELYCEPNLLTLSNGANVLSLTDQSAHLRHLTAASSYPTFQTNVVNGKSVVRFNGSQNPLKNTANFTVSCGWIVANFNGATFSDYKGLLSDLVNQTILVSNNSGTNFFDTQIEFFEFRLNDRIYPQSNAPAPMNAFKIIFFRFWKPITVDGIQIGQQTTFTARKWNGDVAFLALYSRNFHETEIRQYSKILADNFALTLADVYPYQADVNNTPEKPVQSVNFYDPPEGDRISEAVGSAKRILDLKFSVADQTEVKEMKSFHAAHYAAAVPFLYRDYRFTPPEDIEGYFDSQPDLDGANNDFTYGFKLKSK